MRRVIHTHNVAHLSPDFFVRELGAITAGPIGRARRMRQHFGNRKSAVRAGQKAAMRARAANVLGVHEAANWRPGRRLAGLLFSVSRACLCVCVCVYVCVCKPYKLSFTLFGAPAIKEPMLWEERYCIYVAGPRGGSNFNGTRSKPIFRDFGRRSLRSS